MFGDPRLAPQRLGGRRSRLLVSPGLREEIGNGEQLYSRAGQPVSVPDRPADRPHRQLLEWHLDIVF